MRATPSGTSRLSPYMFSSPVHSEAGSRLPANARMVEPIPKASRCDHCPRSSPRLSLLSSLNCPLESRKPLTDEAITPSLLVPASRSFLPRARIRMTGRAAATETLGAADPVTAGAGTDAAGSVDTGTSFLPHPTAAESAGPDPSSASKLTGDRRIVHL